MKLDNENKTKTTKKKNKKIMKTKKLYALIKILKPFAMEMDMLCIFLLLLLNEDEFMSL